MIDLDTLRDWLKLQADEHEDDEIIESLEQSAVAIVQTSTGYTYPAVNVAAVEYLWGTGTNELFLSLNPTADPATLVERAAVGDTGTAITAAQSDGWVRRGSRLLRKGDAVWTLGAEYAVTYASGYAAGSEPPEVRQAVMRLVALLYRQRGKEDSESESIGGYSHTKAKIQEILETLPHRGVFA